MKAITANHLHGGQVLFLTEQSSWSDAFAQAALFSDDDAFTAAFAKAQDDEKSGDVVGVYDVDLHLIDGKPTPKKLRERIRVDGPSTAYGENMKFEGFYAA